MQESSRSISGAKNIEWGRGLQTSCDMRWNARSREALSVTSMGICEESCLV